MTFYDIHVYYKPMQGWLVHAMIHCELKDTLEFPQPWHHLSGLLFLDSASSLLSAAEMSGGGLPRWRGVVFCLLRLSADRDPSPPLLTVNISHAVMNV